MAEKRLPKNFIEATEKVAKSSVVIGICNIRTSGTTTVYTNFNGFGSGFFINQNGLLLTSKHVVPRVLNPNEAYFVIQKSNANTAWYSISRNLVYDFPDLDVCGIKFNRKTNFIPFSDKKPKAGEEIGIFGYPASKIGFQNGVLSGGDVKPRVSKTTISNIEVSNINLGSVSFNNKALIETQFIFVKGNSGGPVFNSKTGKIVGIVTGVVHHPQHYHSHNISFNNTQTNVIGIPYASYSYAISILEIIPRLRNMDFKYWW